MKIIELKVWVDDVDADRISDALHAIMDVEYSEESFLILVTDYKPDDASNAS